MNKHCQAAKDHIAVAESGDSKMAAYQRAAEEIERAINEDNLTQQQVADQIGKHQSYVARLLRALMSARITGSEFRVEWSSGSNKRADIVATVPRKLDDQVRMAAELLARPNVADAIVRSTTAASSAVQTAVSRKNSEDRQTFASMAEKARQANAVPVGAGLARIIDKLQDWTGELMAIEPDLVEARDAFMSHALAVTLRGLADQCERIADRIEQDVDAIEGSAR